jgi:uncharacterized protein
MKTSALGLLLCLLAAPVSLARQNSNDAPASKADVERFFEAMHTRELINAMMDTMRKQMRQIIHEQVAKQQNLPPGFEAQEVKGVDEMLRNLPIEEILQAMIPVYEKHFTKRDIDDLVAFYSSPTGQKMLKELPAVTAESMQVSQGIIQRRVAEQMRKVENDVAQAKKQSGGDSKDQH